MISHTLASPDDFYSTLHSRSRPNHLKTHICAIDTKTNYMPNFEGTERTGRVRNGRLALPVAICTSCRRIVGAISENGHYNIVCVVQYQE